MPLLSRCCTDLRRTAYTWHSPQNQTTGLHRKRTCTRPLATSDANMDSNTANATFGSQQSFDTLPAPGLSCVSRIARASSG